jgi:hypothetical protein
MAHFAAREKELEQKVEKMARELESLKLQV